MPEAQVSVVNVCELTEGIQAQYTRAGPLLTQAVRVKLQGSSSAELKGGGGIIKGEYIRGMG